MLWVVCRVPCHVPSIAFHVVWYAACVVALLPARLHDVLFAGAVIIILWSLITSTATFLFLRWALHGTIRMVNAEHEFRLDEEEYPRVGPKGRVTMLFTDIQSSTSLWEADEDTMAECLIMHDNILRLKLKAHNGFEVKTEGDAFMSAFGSCQDALQYCIAVQLELLQQKWPKAIYSNFFARVQV